MHLGIIGTGYVGLVTGVCFAEFGLNVTCVDKDRKKIAALKKGIVPFYEPGLEELLKKNLSTGRLSFSTKVADAVDSALVVFIAVGTPPRGDGSADLKYVESVAKGIAARLNGYKVIVTKSTVPVGTGQKLRQIISKSLKGRVDFDIVSNPEFLREGAAIEDFMRPDRVIIGAHSQQAVAIMRDLYRPLYLIETPFVITDVQSAELIKYASNCFLATKVSFINEMANLCEKVDADVHTVAKGMGFDRRIGPKFLHPGPGFGGSCFPKDLNALHQIARNNQSPLRIVEAAVQANEAQRNLMVKKIKTAMGSLEGKKIAVLGLSFKPNTDDIRDAPSVFIINRLIEEGAKPRVYDPVAMENAKAVLPKVSFSKDPYSAAKGAHALVIVTEWNEFRNLELHRIKKLLKEPYFFDLRNIYEPARMKEEGFKYFCVGRPT
ncbi:MAG: UDP-glucose/GDP-mannose dehydrogenase family protein [Nitrospirota bacterium]|jgi:UDPglucose 6-dehydrogenase